MEVRYPDITVNLSGGDGNVYMVLGKVRKALRRAGVGNEVIAAFTKEAESGDYDNALATCFKWVDVA